MLLLLLKFGGKVNQLIDYLPVNLLFLISQTKNKKWNESNALTVCVDKLYLLLQLINSPFWQNQ